MVTEHSEANTKGCEIVLAVTIKTIKLPSTTFMPKEHIEKGWAA